MIPIEEPCPRDLALPWQPFNWPVRRTITLRSPSPPPLGRFADILLQRRSDRRMLCAPLGSVVELLRFCSRTRVSWVYEGLDRHQSPVISGGALQGINLLLAPSSRSSRLFRYDRTGDRLDVLNTARPNQVRRLRQHVQECLPVAVDGVTVVFVADRAKYDAAYRSSETLIWRDSGALLQVIAMSASALGLAACPVGIHGDEIIGALTDDCNRLFGCGVIQVGRHAPDAERA